MKLSTESCLQVNRFKYELQPATTCNKDSGLRQKEQSAVEDKTPFCKVSAGRKGVVYVADREVKNVFWEL